MNPLHEGVREGRGRGKGEIKGKGEEVMKRNMVRGGGGMKEGREGGGYISE